MLNDTYPFELPPLPYDYDDLEPYIDTETMHYHHDKHFQTYITNLNNALAPYPALQKLTLRELLASPNLLPTKVFLAIMRNGGGVYNHDLFFKKLAPPAAKNHQPTGALLAAIENTFGSFDHFKEVFTKQALAVFGSGYTYLIMLKDGALQIVNLANQDTLLADGYQPLILVDVWEHAYYLKYKNSRADYLKNIWQVIKFPVL